MKPSLCIPSRCTAKLPNDFDVEHLVGEEKIDGSRYVLYIGEGVDPYDRQAGNVLLSRRVSTVDAKHVDRTGNAPHITLKLYPDLNGTVLDGEITAKDFLKTNSIMNSTPSEAVKKQKDLGLLDYRVFDVMYFRGIDVRKKPLSERRKILEAVVARMANPNVFAIPQITGDLEKYFNEIVSKGGEGIIVKDSRMAYGVGWAKMKKSYDVSCFVSGFHAGEGKYKGGVGSILISVMHEGEPLEIGRASGFDDKIRADMKANPKKFLNRVVDIYVQEIQDSKRSKDNPVGRVRHPTFFRFRDDMNAEDCTSEKLEADIAAAKSRFKRERERE